MSSLQELGCLRRIQAKNDGICSSSKSRSNDHRNASAARFGEDGCRAICSSFGVGAKGNSVEKRSCKNRRSGENA